MSRACPDLWEPRVGNSPGPPGQKMNGKYEEALHVDAARDVLEGLCNGLWSGSFYNSHLPAFHVAKAP